MGVFALDSFVDTTGTAATAHTPEVGGPIVSGLAGSNAVITAANRMRGNSSTGSLFLYSGVPGPINYAVEAGVYCASNVNGFGLCVRGVNGNSGYSVQYSQSTGNIVLAGGGLSPTSASYSPTVGQRDKFKLQIANSSEISVYINNVRYLHQFDTGIMVAGLAGFLFSNQDTDSTGLQLDSFSAYDILPTTLELSGQVLCDRGPFLSVNSDNVLYLVNLTDLISGSILTGATVTAQVQHVPDGTVIATVSLVYVVGSVTLGGKTYTGANYRGQVLYGAGILPDTDYNVVVVAVQGSNQFQGVARLPGQYD